MAKYLTLKLKYEDNFKRIPATDVRKEHGRLLVFDGEKPVGDFSEDDVQYWSLEESAGA